MCEVDRDEKLRSYCTCHLANSLRDVLGSPIGGQPVNVFEAISRALAVMSPVKKVVIDFFDPIGIDEPRLEGDNIFDSEETRTALTPSIS